MASAPTGMSVTGVVLAGAAEEGRYIQVQAIRSMVVTSAAEAALLGAVGIPKEVQAGGV